MVWIAGDDLCVRFPPAPGHDKGHVTRFTADEVGTKALSSVLRARAKAQDHRVGFPGTPTQSDIQRLQAMARAVASPKPKPNKRHEEHLALEDLIHDLDLEGIL
jgi:hypothetical protein